MGISLPSGASTLLILACRRPPGLSGTPVRARHEDFHRQCFLQARIIQVPATVPAVRVQRPPARAGRLALADRYLKNPLSIDARAVTSLGDALYKDIRLSGNRVRALRAR